MLQSAPKPHYLSISAFSSECYALIKMHTLHRAHGHSAPWPEDLFLRLLLGGGSLSVVAGGEVATSAQITDGDCKQCDSTFLGDLE